MQSSGETPDLPPPDAGQTPQANETKPPATEPSPKASGDEDPSMHPLKELVLKFLNATPRAYEWLKKELAEARKVPATIILCIAISAVASWWVTKYFMGQQIDSNRQAVVDSDRARSSLRDTITGYQLEIGKAKDAISGLLPEATARQIATNLSTITIAPLLVALTNHVTGLSNRMAVTDSKIALLEASMAPRVITDEQKRTVLSTLKANNKKAIFGVLFAGDDDEQMAYARQFVEIFKKAGYECWEGMGTPMIAQVPSVDVYFGINPESQENPDVKMVYTAFQAARIPVKWYARPGYDLGMIMVSVGKKPKLQ
jgi:hypothetical protein